jgi:hypothetical protein
MRSRALMVIALRRIGSVAPASNPVAARKTKPCHSDRVPARDQRPGALT